MAAATEVIRRSMSTLSGLFTKKLPTGIWQFTFDEVGKGMKYVVNGRRYEFLAINGVMGITIDATNEKQLWYVISDDCTVQIEEVGQSANPFFSIHQEQGIFTPTLVLATLGDLAITYTTQLGFYSRIGDLVHIDINLIIATISNTTGSGYWEITGLPLPIKTLAGYLPFFQLQVHGIDFPAVDTIHSWGGSGNSFVYLAGSRDNADGLSFTLSNTTIVATDRIRICGTYRTD
jgi:hypothetical protein